MKAWLPIIAIGLFIAWTLGVAKFAIDYGQSLERDKYNQIINAYNDRILEQAEALEKANAERKVVREKDLHVIRTNSADILDQPWPDGIYNILPH